MIVIKYWISKIKTIHKSKEQRNVLNNSKNNSFDNRQIFAIHRFYRNICRSQTYC